MKKLILLPLLLFFVSSYGQLTEAPWMTELIESRRQANTTASPDDLTKFTFHEMQEAFNAYWETRDPNVKGSGYKPFKRWEYIWEHTVDENGYLPTPQDMWRAWEMKNNAANQRAVTADLSNWQAIGPFTHTNTGSWSSGQARINAIAEDPNNSNTWYVGAPAGGLWKSTNAGGTWAPMTDNLPQIGVSGIAIDYNDSNTIYIATGDDDAGDTQSAGVFKTTDGGTTWTQTGLNPSNTPSSMNDIYIHPTNSNILWVATNSGVFKTTDAGATWTNTQSGNIKDLKLKPGDPNTIYAVSTNTFYKSTNGGDSFTSSSTGLPSGSGRLVIDVTPANSSFVYVLAVDTGYAYQGVYRSNNSGDSFTARNTSGPMGSCTQGWYDLAFGVSSTDATEVYIGCLNVWRSTNGASSFTEINSWSNPNGATYTHADIHMIRSFNGDIYVASDGGIYRSTNSGGSFTDFTAGIQASQFYKIAVSPSNPNKMVGGLQDNGGHAYNNGSGNWLNYYGADGMDTAIDPTNDNRYYGFIQNGGGLYRSNNAGSSSAGSVGQPSGSTGNWVTPLAMSSTGQLYAGYNRLYRLNGAGTGWVTLANLGNPADQIEIAPSDETRLYIAVDAILKRSNDSGSTVSDMYTFGGNIKGIGVHGTNPDIVWVTTNSAVFRSEDGGSTFTNITGTLPTSNPYVFLNDIVHHTGATQNPVYVATSIGVYRTVDGGTWEPFFNNLPTTIVTDLEINLADNSLTAATYGRGVWRTSLPNCTTVTATQEMELDGGGFQTVTNLGACVGQSITLRPTVVTGSSPTYSWTGPNGFTASGQNVTISNITMAEAGDYVVSIDGTGTCGAVDFTFSIDLEEALQPASSDVYICSNTSTTLNASGSTDYRWYDAPSGGTELGTGSSYTTPNLTANTTYYVAGTSGVIANEIVPSPDISTAGDYNFSQSLIFNTTDEITLNSVRVSAMSIGSRTIRVVDAQGAVVATGDFTLPAGESTVTLNFTIPKGNGYILEAPGTPNLRRTPDGNGVSFPYTSPSGIVSIVGNTVNDLNYYYFFYEWNITSSGGRCESIRTPIQVNVNATNPDMSDGDTTYAIDGGAVTAFNSGQTITTAVGANLDLNLPSQPYISGMTWTSPGGTNYNSNTVNLTNLQDGGDEDGTWTVSMNFNPNCGTSPQVFNFTVNVDAALSVNDFEFGQLVLYPNPATNDLTIESNETLSGVSVTITDSLGRLIMSYPEAEMTSDTSLKINVSNLSTGTYFLKLQNDSKASTKKFVKQ